ncbi:MAG: hypothetical protein IIX36_04375 [Clostridia bacterium]|nr:hypothetical protein [Clostridia bacterium]
MKFIKKLIKAFLIMLLIIVVVITGLIIALINSEPDHTYLLTEEQVEALIVEQVRPQLSEIAQENGFSSLELDLDFYEFEYKEANKVDNGTISVRIQERYSGGPFTELEAGIYSGDIYKKYAHIKRVDYSSVKIDKYDLDIRLDTNAVFYNDTQGNTYCFTLGLIKKNDETVDDSLFWSDDMEKILELWDRSGGGSYVSKPFAGESISDYIKRVDPDLYKSIKGNYDRGTD